MYRNLITLLQELLRALDNGECATRADLARKFGVSRAHVARVMSLLDLALEVADAVAAIGDLIPGPFVSRRSPSRQLVPAPNQQRRAWQNWAVVAAGGPKE